MFRRHRDWSGRKEVIKSAKAFDMSVIAGRDLLLMRKPQSLVFRELKSLMICNLSAILYPCTWPSPPRPSTFFRPIALPSCAKVWINRPKHSWWLCCRQSSIGKRALKRSHTGAGLDVDENELVEAKGEFSSVLGGVPNWIGTHHIGASTTQAQTATADETVRIIETYVNTGNG